MPPRQPLKLKTSTRRSTKKPLSLAEALPQISADIAAASPKPAKKSSFSPYPDLTMAVEMLEKRAAHLTDGERKSLILKWKDTLGKLNEEMQKLHKLEILANRLITPKS
ncbi:MAG: hypothetical protein DI628_01270 [Blastochloris viridis]|uniref:Uncharacterized protein n=1 Tax=Blastochloris viridis TaxID=1079 RepID=A0A6N4RDB3_BLAVI|nr:MAG: hypothetical protein DI628_01270 [Blastochloris viridis]